MELSTLPNSVFRFGKHSIPAVGLGTYLLKGQTGLTAIKHAIKSGYRLLDTAHLYENEELVGQAVNECIEEGIITREDMFITSKLANVNHNPSRIAAIVQHQVDKLGLGYIDLYLIHSPCGQMILSDKEEAHFGVRPLFNGDEAVANYFSLKDVWKMLEECVDRGLVKHIGVSNFDNEQVELILDNCRIRPFNNQVEIHPWLSQEELIDFHQRKNISVTSFMSLGRAGRSTDHGGNLFESDLLAHMADRYKVSISQLLLRYQLQRGVLVIPKSKTLRRIEENGELFHFSLTEEDMKTIRCMDKCTRSCNFVVNRNNPGFPNSWKKEEFFASFRH